MVEVYKIRSRRDGNILFSVHISQILGLRQSYQGYKLAFLGKDVVNTCLCSEKCLCLGRKWNRDFTESRGLRLGTFFSV